jgi:hypothetical protein
LKEKSNRGSLFFGAITIGSIRKATKNENVQSSIYIFASSSKSCELQQLIPETFRSYYVEHSFESAIIPYQHYSINAPYASVIHHRPSLKIKVSSNGTLKEINVFGEFSMSDPANLHTKNISVIPEN